MNNVNHLKWTLIGYGGSVAVGLALLYLNVQAWGVIICVAFMANVIGYIEGVKS